ncbi:RNA-binding RNA processing protein rpp1, partial [Coemansia furcata]
SSGAWEAVDVISLDMGGRWGYFVKHKIAGQVLATGLALEISYQPALTDSATRQQWVSNAASIVRVTRGRGVIWTSGARQAFDLRSPYDISALGEVLQLNGDLSKRALSTSSRATLVHAFTRTNTLRAVISSVMTSPAADEAAQAQGVTLDDDHFAQAMDAADPLGHLRSEFEIPTVGQVTGNTGEQADALCTYLCGNSLGLLPKRSRRILNEEMDEWATKGVVGHHHHSKGRSWISYRKLIVEKMAPMFGAAPIEVGVMNSLT